MPGDGWEDDDLTVVEEESLAALEAARAEGYAAGREDGRREGYDQGRADGYEAGEKDASEGAFERYGAALRRALRAYGIEYVFHDGLLAKVKREVR